MNNIKTQLQDLMKKDMSRKEFLGSIGVAALVFLNIEPILHMLHGRNGYPPVTKGYSSGGYSGFRGKRPAPTIKSRGFD